MPTFLSTLTRSRSAIFALATIAWVGALIVLALYCPKYVPDGKLLLSSDFEDTQRRSDKLCTKDFGCWSCSENGVLLVEKAGFGSSTGVRLTPEGKYGSSMLWDLPDPRRFDFLEFKGRMRVEDIRIGKEPWDIARCLLYFQDRQETRRWDYPHSAKGLSGSSPWIEFSKDFPVPDFAVSAHVLFVNRADVGSMYIDDILLRSVRINHQFFRNRNILLGIGIMLALTFLFTLRIWEDYGWIILVILSVGALGVLCPHVYLKEIASVLNIKVQVLKRVGHFLVFLMMGVSSSLWLPRRSKTRGCIVTSILYAVYLVAALALFAGLTEFLQVLTIDRTPSLVDYLIDLWGVLTGVLLAFVLTKTQRNRD